MPCDTRLKPRQTIQERAAEVRRVIDRLAQLIASNRVQIKVDRLTGAVAFVGLTEAERDGVTDACMLRRITSGQSVIAKAAIDRAAQIAGRPVNKQVMTTGGGSIHSHDGGKTFHGH